ncbi:unnamed protein product [Ostreobium quekettii]|uniref:Uncharacterized protein n=1 Tax=Ostreobium quekettii TaxID=121088 RepID=A0A8S1JAH9_9CHLO|nr:unnamed protein product [Ostreobium quekettii]|eukprot:evm.model.scf_465EXC.7 EVM.evm.TU.scf_465EXC.7   scf_465EXC:72128-73075(-)
MNSRGTHTAIVTPEAMLVIYSRPREDATRWSREVRIPLVSRSPTGLLAWANEEFGYILAAGTGEGIVKVFELRRPLKLAGGGEQLDSQQPEWSLAQSLDLRSERGMLDLCFAPYQFGLMLAVACGDGRVDVFAPRRLLPAEGWEVKHRITLPEGFGDACQLAWRPYSDGVPQMMAVGGSGGLSVFSYRRERMGWESACHAEGGVMGLDWAPSLGKPLELIATFGAGQDVTVWRLRRGEGGEGLELEATAVLRHTAGVSKVRWDMLGVSLAASTEKNEVWVWSKGAGWEWECRRKIVGVEAGGGRGIEDTAAQAWA